MIYYVDGNFSLRKGIEIGPITLHRPDCRMARSRVGGEVDRDDGNARTRRHV